MEHPLVYLNPGDIDSSGSWLFWSEKPDQAFLQSVASWGILQPALVYKQGNGYELVSGWKRLKACQELHKDLPVISVSTERELDKARIYVALNMVRIYNLTDLVVCCRFFQSRMDQSEFSDFLFQEIGGYVHRKRFFGLQDWLCLPNYWDQLLLAGNIHFELASVLSRLSNQDLRDLYPLFANLSWSRNKSKHLITWLFEISRGQDKSISELIQGMGLLDFLEQGLSPKDCQDRILEKARAVRYPCLKQLEDEFQYLQKEISPFKYWRLIPEQHFETNGLYLQTLIRDRSDSHQALAELKRLVEEERLESLWKWQSRRLD